MRVKGLLPKPRSRERQRMMFDIDQLSHGMCRVMVGDFMEEATACLTSSVRLRTDCRCEICPDIQYSKRLFFESKSVGNTDQAIIYQSRLRKDVDFCLQGYQLCYWFWHHHCQVSKAESKTALFHEIALRMQDVMVVPLRMIWRRYGHKSPKLLNNAMARNGKMKTGWGGPSYGYGWNIPLQQWRAMGGTRVIVPKLNVYDVEFTNLRVQLLPDVPSDVVMSVILNGGCSLPVCGRSRLRSKTTDWTSSQL